MFAPLKLPAAIALLVVLSACAQYDNQRGVNVYWDNDVSGALVTGQSTRSDVLKNLGPPSQIISLQNGTAFYYLFEHAQGNGLILGVYNRFETQTNYDRAVFFFDQNGVLTDHASHVRP